MKDRLIHGVVAGVLAGIAGVIYLNIYQGALGVEYGQVINMGSIIGSSIIGCMLMTLGYVALDKYNKQQWRGWMNILIAVLSFASIIGPIGMSLPYSVELPELFPGLVVPMHFFPALAFMCINPFFEKHPTSNTQ